MYGFEALRTVQTLLPCRALNEGWLLEAVEVVAVFDKPWKAAMRAGEDGCCLECL
jgi:hypothetical protein